jgi:homeodomain-containing protein
MDERVRFVARLLGGEKMAVLCREFDISRKTGYKIFQRYKDFGAVGLTDRSRRPYRQANQLPIQIETLIVRLRREHPSWGAPKIRAKRRFIDLDHFEGWFGVVGPRGTSNAAIERVNMDLGTVFALPGIVERFDMLGVYVKTMTPAQFGATGPTGATSGRKCSKMSVRSRSCSSVVIALSDHARALVVEFPPRD